MKRTDLLRHLKDKGCELYREGGRHTIYWNPANQKTSSIPRHREIVEPVVASILSRLS